MLLDRFINYIKIDTQSDEESGLTPSTLKQLDLLNLLKKELDDLGVENSLDEYGRLYAHLEGNTEFDCIGLCAHVDTASEASGKNVNPQIIKNYDGSDIKLGSSGLILSKNDTLKLNDCIGKTLITTDGTTLLGGDDKCGLAIIMETLENVMKLPVKNRRPFSLLFTPDEEIGRGPENFDPKKYKAKFAYTIDGDDPHLINIESFNAKSCEIEIKGKSIHPGDAKGVMVNAALVLNEFISMLPADKVPSKTCNKEGFNHLYSINGGVEYAKANYIIRNHDRKLLNEQTEDFIRIQKILNEKYPTGKVSIKINDQYSNMVEVINEKPECKNHIENVFNKLGLKYKYVPIRGGTDGATFSFKGVPCPNLGTGSYNHHGRYEFAVLEEMELLVKICTEIFKI